MDSMLLTADQTATALNISPRTLWTLTDDGALPAIRIRRRVLYSRDDLQRFIDDRRGAGKSGRLTQAQLAECN